MKLDPEMRRRGVAQEQSRTSLGPSGCSGRDAFARPLGELGSVVYDRRNPLAGIKNDLDQNRSGRIALSGNGHIDGQLREPLGVALAVQLTTEIGRGLTIVVDQIKGGLVG